MAWRCRRRAVLLAADRKGWWIGGSVCGGVLCKTDHGGLAKAKGLELSSEHRPRGRPGACRAAPSRISRSRRLSHQSNQTIGAAGSRRAGKLHNRPSAQLQLLMCLLDDPGRPRAAGRRPEVGGEGVDLLSASCGAIVSLWALAVVGARPLAGS